MIYLYVKQHADTKLKYFGKTTKQDPYNYNGSGKYWKTHINKHGKEHITTLNVWSFEDQELCTKFALDFSKDNNIVESKEWANLQDENGLDGVAMGAPCSDETRAKMSAARKGAKHSDEAKAKMSAAWQQRGPRAPRGPHSDETKARMSAAAKMRGLHGPHSDEAKAKMSESQQKRGPRAPHSDEHRAKTSATLKARGPRGPRRDETKAKMVELLGA